MVKVFVLDTNVILHDPYCIYKFGENEIIIPAVVLEELDSKKRMQDEIGKNAREFIRIIDALKMKYPHQLSEGVPLETGGVLRIELNHVSFEKLEKYFHERNNDNRILAVALNLHLEYEEKGEDKQVVFVTNDILPGIKGDSIKLITEKYENDRLVDDLDNIHKGYHEVEVPSDIITRFYQNERLSFVEIEEYVSKKVYPQDFFILKSNDGSGQSAIGRLLHIQNERRIVPFSLYKKEQVFGIKARNAQQRMGFELLLDPKVELVCMVGPAGTGKTLLALAAALQQTEKENDYKKILVARPVIPMGKDIGFLPGDMDEKMRPWMQPIFDNLEYIYNIDEEEESNEINKIVEGLKLDIEALTYIRGRSIPKQYIIIDEAQNLTPHEIKTIITRAGKGTKIVLVGDPDQIDHPYLDGTNNALTYVIEKMKHLEEVGVIRLEKTERSSLAEKAAKLL